MRAKLLWQLVFWTISYFILLNMFSDGAVYRKIDYIYTSVFLATLILAVTVNEWVLVPRYLNRRRYSLFFFLCVITIVGGTFFNQLLFSRLIDYVLPGYYFISYYSFADLLKFFVVFVGLTTMLHLSSEWFRLQEDRHRLVLLEKEKINAELRALTSQVNPHFLFNSLTVLYSLSLKNSRETSGAIIKLSDILRYVIYESAKGEVPLSSEIVLIQNYIDLQRYRVDRSARVTFTTDVQNNSILISPMILLPLVENSFKYGIQGGLGGVLIEIQLQSAGGVVNFHIVNNKSYEAPTERPSGGFGLKNIEERLRLIYRDRHIFEVTETEHQFTVRLQITTKHEKDHVHHC